MEDESIEKIQEFHGKLQKSRKTMNVSLASFAMFQRSTKNQHDLFDLCSDFEQLGLILLMSIYLVLFMSDMIGSGFFEQGQFPIFF